MVSAICLHRLGSEVAVIFTIAAEYISIPEPGFFYAQYKIQYLWNNDNSPLGILFNSFLK